jgi:predicted nucleic acid-binding protein
MLVVDASLAVELALDRIGERTSADLGRDGELIAPPLLWSEVPSVLHEIAFRGEISDALAELALQRSFRAGYRSRSAAQTVTPPLPGRSPRNSAG